MFNDPSQPINTLTLCTSGSEQVGGQGENRRTFMALHSLINGCGDDYHRWTGIRSRRRRQALANMQRGNDTIPFVIRCFSFFFFSIKERMDVLGDDSFSSGRSLGDNVGTFNHKRQNSCLNLVGRTDSTVPRLVSDQSKCDIDEMSLLTRTWRLISTDRLSSSDAPIYSPRSLHRVPLPLRAWSTHPFARTGLAADHRDLANPYSAH